MRILILWVALATVSARPWNIHDIDRSIEITPQISPLMKTIDSMSSSFSKTLKTASPGMIPALSLTGLAYVGYIAAVMFFPSVLVKAGLPTLEDFSIEARSSRTSSGFIDNLANGFMTDLIGRTEAADVVRNTSATAVTNSMATLKKTTRLVNLGLTSLQGTVNNIVENLSPACLTRHMCRVGQFTSVHFPMLGSILRSINTRDLDDYSQALIDGTTIGDCSAVFHTCPL